MLNKNDIKPHDKQYLYIEVVVLKKFSKRILCNFFDNRIPKIGERVVIDLQTYFDTAIVIGYKQLSTQFPYARKIIVINNESPIINSPKYIEYLQWVAKYYLCTEGDVFDSAIPSILKIDTTIYVSLNIQINIANFQLNKKEHQLIEFLAQSSEFLFDELVQLGLFPGMKNTLRVLQEKKIILLHYRHTDRYREKTIKQITLDVKYWVDCELQRLIEELTKNSKQLEVLLFFLSKISKKNGRDITCSLKKSEFNEIGLESSLRTLIKKGIFLEREQIISRIASSENKTNQLPVLTVPQERCFEEIKNLFKDKAVVLLHGVTGSGKTAIYVQLISAELQKGNQVLFLLPEIAITTQITERLSKLFAYDIGLYHSKCSPAEKGELWYGVLGGKIKIVLGVRSSVFLPFKNLSLVIVDEEHDPSFKQNETAPRYNAKDTATVLAQRFEAKVLLGSATPSIESFYFAQTGKYGFVSLSERYNNYAFPVISVINSTKHKVLKTLKNEFALPLIEAMHKILEKNKQILIFQNKRGYAPKITCSSCGVIPFCLNCSVALIYHQYFDLLRCHYCGYSTRPPSTCRHCNSSMFKNIGFGTEKLEESLREIFVDKKIERIDLDTTRTKKKINEILKNIQLGKVDIIIGTQMVTKGLDFANVALVGVMQMDQLLYSSDFRANERCFQTIIQVVGRAGRSQGESFAMIQCSHTAHKMIKDIENMDYLSMYKKEISDRLSLKYPPFVRIIRLNMSHKNKERLYNFANYVFRSLNKWRDNFTCSEPIAPHIDRVKDKYILDIWIKLENLGLVNNKNLIKNEMIQCSANKDFKSIKIIYDVDPS